MANFFVKKPLSQLLGEAAAQGEGTLKRTLGAWNLVALGIGAIIGAGLFVRTASAAAGNAGSAVTMSFIVAAIGCAFAGLCYAEFAAMIPIAGSAYTYAYTTMGELVAWVIGWALIMEYAIGNITVAISWSDYFTSFVNSVSPNFQVPQWMTMDYFSAYHGFNEAELLLRSGKTFENIAETTQQPYFAWKSSPQILGFHVVLDLPALFIIVLITMLVYRGMKESRNASNIMVAIKLAVVFLVIIVGSFYVQPSNWNPFMPNGVPGVLKGVSAVFFAYIGFDAISTTAEECENPQRDLPRGMMWAIIICTILYVAIALVLTGMVKYDLLAVGDPLAFVFQKYNMPWMSGVIGFSAIFAMASVLLVFQLGQPRIWMAISRDGLLPKAFSKIHPKYKTPSFATIVTGFVVAIPALFLNLTMVTDLCSIGTLFAFVLVCGGVLMLQNKDIPRGKFKTPYLNAKYIMPILFCGSIALLWQYSNESFRAFVFNTPKQIEQNEFIPSLAPNEIDIVKGTVLKSDSIGFVKQYNDLELYVTKIDEAQYTKLLSETPISVVKKTTSGWSLFKHKLPFWFFLITSLVLSVLAFQKNLSLIPILGVLSCLYLMSQIELKNWIGFAIWLVIGLVIYLGYGIKNSKLNTERSEK